MKVGELKILLEKYPSETTVMVTWEGVYRTIKPSNLYLAANGKLMIDADDNAYKEDITSGKLNP